jgi:hypothetical protein
MKTRILPEPDHFATCPQGGIILRYYEGTFDSVFVALHPFIRPATISKEAFKPATYPNRLEIVKGAKPVRWEEIINITNLPSLAAIDVGLRTGICGLKKAFANEAYAKIIRSLYESHDLIRPDEGNFSDFLHDVVLGGFQSLGHQWVWVGDELGTERKLYWIDDLKADEKETTSGHRNIFTPDKSLLWTTHWDSHFSFLCGSHAHVKSLVHSLNLEGFFCNRETEVYWSTSSSK